MSGEIAADLIVAGSRRLGPIKRVVMGSVSEEKARRAACPVLVVPGREVAWPPARVMVGEDLFGHTVEAAELAASLGGAYGAEVFLVRSAPLRQTDRKSRDSRDLRTAMEARAANGPSSELAVKTEMTIGRRPETRITAGTSRPRSLMSRPGVRDRSSSPWAAARSGVLERFGSGGIPSRILRAAKGPVLIHRHPPPEDGA